MGRIVSELFPLVFAVIHDQITEADIEKMYEAYRAVHERGERFVLMQDARAAKLPDAATRQRLSKLNAHFESDIEKHVIGIAVVVPNRLYAGAVQALYWMSKENAPTKAVPSAIDALEHALAIMPEDLPPFPATTRATMEELDKLWREKRTHEFVSP